MQPYHSVTAWVLIPDESDLSMFVLVMSGKGHCLFDRSILFRSIHTSQGGRGRKFRKLYAAGKSGLTFMSQNADE